MNHTSITQAVDSSLSHNNGSYYNSGTYSFSQSGLIRSQRAPPSPINQVTLTSADVISTSSPTDANGMTSFQVSSAQPNFQRTHLTPSPKGFKSLTLREIF